MKHILGREFIREILRNKGRFLSVFFIVMLGAAFFSGIRSSGGDMKETADRYYDDTRMMDIRVVSALGLTEEDLEDMRSVDQVEEVQGGYTQDVLVQADESELAVRLIAQTDQVNLMQLESGREIEKSNECVLDARFMKNKGYSIGDTITIISGTDSPLEETVSEDTFTIVGSGNLPYYMDLTRGVGSIGDGSLSGYLVVSPEVFDLDVYTEAYIRVTGAERLNTYSDAYQKLIDSVSEDLESCSDSCEQRRYDSIYQDAEEEIDDGKQKVSETKQKLEDAKAELDDGEEKLKTGEKKLQDTKKELDDGESKLQSTKQQLDTAKAQLFAAREQLDTAASQLSTAASELEQGKQQLDASRTKLEEGSKELEVQETLLTQKKEELSAGWQQYQSGLQTLEQMKAVLPSESEEIRQLEEQLAASYQQLTEFQAQADEAETQLEQQKAVLEAGKVQLAEAESQYQASLETYEQKTAEYNVGETEYAASLAEYQKGEQEYEAGLQTWEEGKQKYDEALEEYNTSVKKWEDGQEEYQQAEEEAAPKIEDAETKIADAENQLDDLEVPEWYILDRDKISSCVSYGADADRMDSLGNVFPVLFFLVAALVSLTAMTRMVEEQRLLIGTMKALGYGNKTIAGKYLGYALLATVTGAVIGVIIGEKTLPWVILSAYKILYAGLPYLDTPFNITQGAVAVILSVVCTGGAALAACGKALSDSPARLMRPEAPMKGSRILLERIPFLWKRLSFTRKSTLRNLFRYKKRFIMTVIGIGGCMGLMLVGFGIRDSITVVAQNQFVEIFMQDATVSVDTGADEADKDKLFAAIDSYDGVTESMQVSLNSVTLNANGTDRSAYLYVPENAEQVSDFVRFRNRTTKEDYTFPVHGAALSEKTASMLDVEVGDTIRIQKGEGEPYVEVTVETIVENYVQHYAFVSPDIYEKLYGESPEYNLVYVRYDGFSEKEEEEFGRTLLKLDACTGFSTTASLEQQIDDMLKTLNYIVWVLIIAAALLAFVVLYNLNSINITERKRELATLKVLGFYDPEVAMYVYRENILLTLMGIAVGCVFGRILHLFTILTVEVDLMMFGRVIGWKSYVICAVLTIVFSVLVNLIMYRHFRKIDMIESLKSVE